MVAGKSFREVIPSAYAAARASPCLVESVSPIRFWKVRRLCRCQLSLVILVTICSLFRCQNFIKFRPGVPNVNARENGIRDFNYFLGASQR